MKIFKNKSGQFTQQQEGTPPMKMIALLVIGFFVMITFILLGNLVVQGVLFEQFTDLTNRTPNMSEVDKQSVYDGFDNITGYMIGAPLIFFGVLFIYVLVTLFHNKGDREY